MNLVTNVLVSRFRSIHEGTLDTLQDFSVLAGLNNSGKSNFLRAINLFFTGAIKPGLALDLQRDFFRPELSQKKRKRIAVELSFALPTTFKFRSDLAYVGESVGTAPTIRKEWNPAERTPAVFLNKSDKPLSVEEAQRIENFLRLISVRYIPNRVIPTELIAQEHQAIRNVLVRRLAKFKGQSTRFFNAIEKTSLELMTDVSALMKSASPDLTNVSLSTATSLADLAFRFGYLLSEGETQTSENEQGSGIQSLLMFRTLSLIDQDLFKQFGWKQGKCLDFCM